MCLQKKNVLKGKRGGPGTMLGRMVQDEHQPGMQSEED